MAEMLMMHDFIMSYLPAVTNERWEGIVASSTSKESEQLLNTWCNKDLFLARRTQQQARVFGQFDGRLWTAI